MKQQYGATTRLAMRPTRSPAFAQPYPKQKQRARREALEEAAGVAKTVSHDLSMAELHAEKRVAQGIYKSIRGLIPSEPHDVEGRE